MRQGSSGFTLIDLLGAVAVLALVMAVAAPASLRMRELSRRLTCSVNLGVIGAAELVYSQSNDGFWSTPAFSTNRIDNHGIDYTPTFTSRDPPSDPGEIGQGRAFESTSQTPQYPGIDGSTAVSVTRAFWMLVRSGDVIPRQFICPSSTNIADDTENIELYYDFQTERNISYGYQVPFGPPDTKARTTMDNRQAVAADRGPYYRPSVPDLSRLMVSAGPNGTPVKLDDAPEYWRLFNSYNHGGWANSDGQNILHIDGHVGFERIPSVGVDNDNIYTLMRDDWENDQPSGANRIHGVSPHISAATDPYPGQNAFGMGVGKQSSTDSLIFP